MNANAIAKIKLIEDLILNYLKKYNFNYKDYCSHYGYAVELSYIEVEVSNQYFLQTQRTMYRHFFSYACCNLIKSKTILISYPSGLNGKCASLNYDNIILDAFNQSSNKTIIFKNLFTSLSAQYIGISKFQIHKILNTNLKNQFNINEKSNYEDTEYEKI